ncbi:hypothetical protein DRH29_02090 [candidate division Kazan bacterium]|uniref:DUF177 domain-containing protein n=1 Tax=candidate division Kazan bacterium TaxID=2202143 RepID=A0A420ZCX9_UNCK3|nr:MAG: hypothetical protein DRH29_02090 [candidate division Kazan bacterium]
MKIDVTKLVQKEIGATAEYDLDEQVEVPDKGNAQVSGRVTLTNLDQSILARFEALASLNLNCDKCLESFRYQTPLNFDREYLKTKTNDPEALTLDNNSLDIDPAISQEILLNLPLQAVCKPDCKGLDPETGKNLNQES